MWLSGLYVPQENNYPSFQSVPKSDSKGWFWSLNPHTAWEWGIWRTLPYLPAWELKSQGEALLTAPSTKEAYLVGTWKRTFSGAAPCLWNQLPKEVCLPPPYPLGGRWKRFLMMAFNFCIYSWFIGFKLVFLCLLLFYYCLHYKLPWIPIK